MSDPTIERIEAELRESRTQAWDVETFLANRHQAKIDALTQPENRLARRWAAVKEVASYIYFGLFLVMIGVGIGTQIKPDRVIVQRYDSDGLLMPPSAPAARRIH